MQFHNAPGIRNQWRIACWETSASVQPLKAGAAYAVGGGWCVLIPGGFLDTFDPSKVSPRRVMKQKKRDVARNVSTTKTKSQKPKIRPEST